MPSTRDLVLLPDVVRRIKKYATSSARARGEHFDGLPEGLFDWIPFPRVRRDSLFGVALTPLLKIFSSIHGPVCNCHRQALLWNYHVAETAESRGWAPEDLAKPLDGLTQDEYCVLLDAAFCSFAQEVGVDLSSSRERVRCGRIVNCLPEDLIADATFKRVICKYTGGWLLVMGPEELRKDKRLLLDILSTERRDPRFLLALEEDFLLSCPEILLLWPWLMEMCEVFRRDHFLLEVLELDHRFAKHLKRSTLELPWMAPACGRSFLRYFERKQRQLIGSCLPSYPIAELVKLLLETNGMLEEFFLGQGHLNSKLRGALVDYALALADFSCFEPWEPLFELCQKLARLVRHRLAPGPSTGGACVKKVETYASTESTTAEETAVDALTGEVFSSGPKTEDGKEAEENRQVLPTSLELEIAMANENARIEKLSSQRIQSSLRKRYKKLTKKVAGPREEDAGEDEVTEVPPVAWHEKKSSAEPRRDKDAPLLLSDKPLEELLQPASEKKEGKSSLDRKLRKREGRMRKHEEQQQRLAFVFL